MDVSDGLFEFIVTILTGIVSRLGLVAADIIFGGVDDRLVEVKEGGGTLFYALRKFCEIGIKTHADQRIVTAHSFFQSGKKVHLSSLQN